MTIPFPLEAMQGADRQGPLNEALASARELAQHRIRLLRADVGRIAEEAGYTVGDVRGHVRTAELVEVRRIIVRYLRSQDPPVSWPAIGEAINREHSSAMRLLRPQARGPKRTSR